MLTQKELREMARLHERWLEGESDGQRADFSGMELTRLNFSGLAMQMQKISINGGEPWNTNA